MVPATPEPATARLTGWGRTSHAVTTAHAAITPEDATRLLRRPAPGGRSAIAFGAGRSYGDVALNGGGDTLLSAGLDRISAHSPEGVLTCGPGVSFRQVLDTCLSKGWAMPVSPGTAFATVGGAIANDVHGKNHDRMGSFGDHVAWLRLAKPDGTTARISPEEDGELFAATIGGLGLTGVILEAGIRLVRIASSDVVVREERAGDIAALMAGLRRGRDTATYTVAWIDAVARGRHLGRGILQTAETAPDGLAAPSKSRSRRLPLDLPGFALNPLTIALFNEVYYRRVPSDGRERRMPLESFLYPLDALLDWNRMYGRRGFYQFQCVVPEAASDEAIPRLLETIAADGSGSFLAVLKTLGGDGRGFLSFPMRGFTLALDFPARARTPALLHRLEQLTLDAGGRIYLAKDACLSAEGFRRMYPGLERFRAVLDRVDPERRMGSDLSRRLRLREA